MLLRHFRLIRLLPGLGALVVAAAISVATPRTTLAAEAPPVVASIAPLHSLVAAVMEPVGAPVLLLSAGASPHAASLKPSAASALEDARLIFWVGPSMEVFLTEAVPTLAPDATAVPLGTADGLIRLPLRTDFGRDHDDHADHADHDHGGMVDEHGVTIDTHLWLDPVNARAMVRAIAAALAHADPANAAAYRQSAAATDSRLEALIGEMESILSAAGDQPVVMFHDAFQYLERRFGLNAAGVVAPSPGHQPGARQIQAIRAHIAALQARCVFIEPQFDGRIARILVEGSDTGIGTLDPIGISLTPGPDLYFELMRQNAKSLRDCSSTGSP